MSTASTHQEVHASDLDEMRESSHGRSSAECTALGMGVLGIGLGLCQVLAPRLMARVTGLNCPQSMMLFGLREIATGVGLLTSQHQAGWMWARTAGDVMDLSALGSAFMRAHEEGDIDRQHRVLASITTVAGVTALDAIAATRLSCSSDCCD